MEKKITAGIDVTQYVDFMYKASKNFLRNTLINLCLYVVGLVLAVYAGLVAGSYLFLIQEILCLYRWLKRIVNTFIPKAVEMIKKSADRKAGTEKKNIGSLRIRVCILLRRIFRIIAALLRNESFCCLLIAFICGIAYWVLFTFKVFPGILKPYTDLSKFQLTVLPLKNAFGMLSCGMKNIF